MATPQLPTHETETLTRHADVVTLDEAATMLGKTGSRVRQMIEAKNFAKVWKLGTRPTYLLDRAEVRKMARASR